MSMQYIRDYYKVPAKRGMTVREKRNPDRVGKITSTHGSHLRVMFIDLLAVDEKIAARRLRAYSHPLDLQYLVGREWKESEPKKG